MANSRSQPYRIKWPLTPAEVENIDDMLERLFKRVQTLEAAASATSSASTVLVAAGVLGRPGREGEPGRRGFPGLSASQVFIPESRVILTGVTRTIADTYDSIHVDYLDIQGTGALVLEGDGVLAII